MYSPLAIYPEGGTTNGKYLIQFKRGAFTSLRAVKPIILKYQFPMLSPCWDGIPFFPLCIMHMSLFDFKCVI